MMMMFRRRLGRFLGAVLLVAASAACTGPGNPAPTGRSSPAGAAGGHVGVLGLWSGPELDSFRAVTAAWEQDTGGVVDWSATQDPRAALDARRAAGNPPEIAILPNLGLLRQLAADGTLVPLDSVLDMAQTHKDYPPAWIDLGSYRGSPATGWALTDWISEIVLNTCGPDLYDRWVAAEIPGEPWPSARMWS
jgi:alpha-glucoside transport system substrate-binding protein